MVSAGPSRAPLGTDGRWDVAAYHARRGFLTGLGVGDLAALLADGEAHVWLDIVGPTESDATALRDTFGFHPLAIEDVLHLHQRPKLDQYDGHAFLVLYAAEGVGRERGDLCEVDAFVGQNYVVTVHREPVAEIATGRRRWRAALEEPTLGASGRSTGMDVALYVLLDSVVDAYFPVLDAVAEELEAIEERIFLGRGGEAAVQDLVRLRKWLMVLRRVFSPTRDVVNTLIRREADDGRAGTSVYFLDVYDHLARAIDGVDVYRDMVATALTAQVSVASQRLNETMRTMTALATILMTMALVTGVYGMNFNAMPELAWQYGYPWALGLMALAGGLVAWVFRRRGWL
jgi:magnesium transporter